MDHACIRSPAFGGDLGSWAEVKRILMNVAVSTANGFKELHQKREAVLEIVYDTGLQAQCLLGHHALRLAFLLLVNPADRIDNLCSEDAPTELGLSFVEILESGWPIFGIL